MTERQKQDPQSDAPVGAAAAVLGLASHFAVPTLEAWRASVDGDLKGAPYDKKLLWETPEGITVKPLYTRADSATVAHRGDLPGTAPYGRGAEPLSGVLPRWQVRQDCLLASPEGVNAALRDGLARGQTAIGIRLDNAARRGLDGDSPEAADKAGHGGMTITSVNAVRVALQDIDLAHYPVSWRTGAAALPVLAMHLAVAEERGMDLRLLTGSVECDPVRELAKTGHVRGGALAPRFREMAEMVVFCARRSPGMRPVLVNSHVWHNGGASATQELAYTMATGAEYLRRLVAAGISPDAAALSMIFSFSVSTNLFMEVAKLRAARMLWAKIARALGATDENALKMFLHARTSVATKTKWDPYNNMVRSTVESFAAAVGGCNSLYVAPFDETIGRPDEFSMRIARNQQLLLMEEAHLDRVVDPAGGSFYVESLTDSLGRAAWKLFQEVEGAGGIIAAMEAGTVQKAIAASAAKRIDAVGKRRQSVVGVTNYPNPTEEPIRKSHEPRADFLAERCRRVARVKSTRRQSEVRKMLGTVTAAMCQSELGNVVPMAIRAVWEGATVGELTEALMAGDDSEQAIHVTPVPAIRIAEPFEDLRDRVQAYMDHGSVRPRVFLVPFGPLGMRRARADFAFGFYGAGGFEVVEGSPVKTAADGVAAALASGAAVVVACSDDDSYAGMVPDLVAGVRAQAPGIVMVVAGMPESAEQLKAAGVDAFIHVRANVLHDLTALLDRLGIR